MKTYFRNGFLWFVMAQAFFFALSAQAQNWATVTATNITDHNQQKLAAGQLCFLPTDQNDNPISTQIGGGGQALRRQYCSSVSNGVATSFTVPNPAATSPTGLYYRITVKDSSNGQEVLRYTQVTFSGAVFNFDNYAPTNVGNFAPLTGNSVSGNLSVSGNVVATGTVTGTNMPAGQVVTGSGTTNTVTKFTNGPSGVIGDSSISDNGTTVSVSEPVNISGALNATSKNGIQVVGNGTNTTIQAAITAAGTTGAVEIAPGYAGTDSYNNPNGVAVIDFRPNNNALALWSVLQPSAPVNNFPLGNDLALHAGGPADIHLRNRDLQVTSSTSCTASTSCTVTVASPTLYGAAISGNPTAKFSTSA
jgi:hypothetical protein